MSWTGLTGSLFAEYLGQLGNTPWVLALLIALAFFILGQITGFIFHGILHHVTTKTKTDIDDLLIRRMRKPIVWLVTLFGLRVAVNAFRLSEAYARYSDATLQTLIYIVFAYAGIVLTDVLLRSWSAKLAKTSAHRSLVSVLGRIVRISIVIIVFLMVLQGWGIEVGPLLASLGIAGLAVAFALQNTLGNIFGGISVLVDETYHVGDWIELGSGEEGIVEDIGLRSTKIRTWNGELLNIPNGTIANTIVKNYVKPARRERVVVDFGVEYGSDPDRVKRVVLEAVKSVPDVLKDPVPYCVFTAMGDSSIDFSVRAWFPDAMERLMKKDQVTTAVYKALKKARIGIPFPTRTIYMKKSK